MALAVALALLAASVAVYVPWTRIRPAGNRMLQFLASGCTCGGAWLAWQVPQQGVSLDVIATALAFACLCELFLIFLAFSMTSISASILVRLRRTPMSTPQIEADYAADGMVVTRLDRLTDGGYLTVDGDRLGLSPQGQRTVRWFLAVQRFLGHA